MTLLKQLITQWFNLHLDAESSSILILGESEDRIALIQLQNMVSQTVEVLTMEPNIRDETDTVDRPQADAAALSCSVIEVSWQSLTPEALNTLLLQSVLRSNKQTLLLPIWNSSILASGTTPAAYAEQIIQCLQSIEALVGPYAYPILLTPAYAPHLALTRLVASKLRQNGYASLIGVTEANDGADHGLGAQRDAKTEPQLAVRLVERWGPMMVAILAAGKSSRMGRSKQLEPVDGVPMVVKAITTAIQSGVDNLYLVTGAYADEISAMLQKRMLAEHSALRIIHNPHFGDGQSTSVKAMADYLLDENAVASGYEQANSSRLLDTKRSTPLVASIIFMPVDQPYLPALLLARLFRLWQRGIQLAAPSVNNTPRGAPALFDFAFWPHLKEISGDVGAKVILRRFNEQLHTIEVAEKQLLDIDTPADIP